MFGHTNWDSMGHMGFFHGGGLLFWIIIFIVLFLLFNTFKDYNDDRKNKNNPLDILKNKFASGDISKEEYISKKEILNK